MGGAYRQNLRGIPAKIRKFGKILKHIGVELKLPHIFATCGPPLWDDCGDAQVGEGVESAADAASRGGQGERRLAPKSHAIRPLRLHISDRFKAAWKPSTCDMFAFGQLNFLPSLIFYVTRRNG